LARIGDERVAPRIVLLLAAELLPRVEQGGYAVGSFAPRSTALIRPVLRAGQRARSPLIVQISENEFKWFALDAAEFATEFYRAVREEGITVPVVLHLDHTRTVPPINEAIAAGFTSVMIDASALELAENIKLTRAAVEYAHPRSVSVEGELGRIGTSDFVETERDEELYTDPQEAGRFVAETGVDALAVSVRTAHGVYRVRQPKIDYDRLCAIKQRAPVYRVLHGGSGVPAEMMARAIHLPCGAISKINIATDLELAALAALGRPVPADGQPQAGQRLLNAEWQDVSAEDRARAAGAVEETVTDKIVNFLGSRGRADDFR
jgi:ketose-bisphosphate aldolase